MDFLAEGYLRGGDRVGSKSRYPDAYEHFVKKIMAEFFIFEFF